MTKEKLKVQPGDYVIVRRTLQPDELRPVVRITPTGRIIVEIHSHVTFEFNADGSLRGGDRYSVTRILVPTPEERARIHKESLIRGICSMRGSQWEKFPLSLLEDIARLAGLEVARMFEEIPE